MKRAKERKVMGNAGTAIFKTASFSGQTMGEKEGVGGVRKKAV